MQLLLPIFFCFFGSQFTNSLKLNRIQMLNSNIVSSNKLVLKKNMPILVADPNSVKLKSFIKLISNALKTQVIEYTKVDDSTDSVTNNQLEVYPPDIFWHIDSTSASSPFNNVSILIITYLS